MKKWKNVSHSVLHSLRPHGQSSPRFLCPWNSPGKHTGVGSHSLLQGIFWTQGLNPVSWLEDRFFLFEPEGKPNCLPKTLLIASSWLNSTYEFLEGTNILTVVIFQSLSWVRLFAALWTEARLPCPLLSPGVCSNSHPLSKWYHLLSHPLLSPSPLALNLSKHQGLFQWVNSLHRVAKGLEIRFSISPSNEYSGLISFRMYWLDLFVVQGMLKNLLQHYSSKPSVLWGSPFFMVQLSQLYVITGKTIALTI